MTTWTSRTPQKVFLNTYQGAHSGPSQRIPQHRGEGQLGPHLPDLMDSKSLFLTANADTIYFLAMLDLSKGPMVVEVAAEQPRHFRRQWFRFVIDGGTPGPDRGEGGKYLIVPPGYDGPLPDSGYNVAQARTNGSSGSAARSWRTTIPSRSSKDQEDTEDLSLQAGGIWHEHRRIPCRQDQTRADRPAAADRVPRRQWEIVEHGPAQGLHVLRDGQRGRPGGAGKGCSTRS